MKSKFLMLLNFFALSFTLFAEEPREFTDVRKDGSVLKGYLSPPDGKETFPIAILCQGSYSQECSTQSVFPFHKIVASFFNAEGVGVLSIEKKGVDRENFDPDVFHAHNIFENRLSDYERLLDLLKDGKFTGWNSQLVVIGTSEGAWYAPLIGLAFPKTSAVLNFGGTGAWKFEDEITRMLQTHHSSMTEEEIRSQFSSMRADPTPQKFWLQQTYKFWAHSCDSAHGQNVLHLDCPVYLAIGSEDPMIESSDALWRLAQEKNRKNVIYARYEGLTHNMLDDRYTVFQDAAKWASERLSVF